MERFSEDVPELFSLKTDLIPLYDCDLEIGKREVDFAQNS